MAVDAVKLLFTGGGGAGREALTRLLPAHVAEFADADPHADAHIIPMATERAFMSRLSDLCRALQIDLLIPGVDEELLTIAIHRSWHTLPCAVLLPDAEFVATHLDKLRSMRQLAELGIAVPQTFRRAILKPREGRGSRGLQRVGHADGLIIQELLEGQEYTVTMVADRQRRLRAIVPVRVDCKRGVTIRGETEPNATVLEACWQIHLAMPTSGVYNVQGILTTGGFKPFEINPRVSTTLCLALAAGVDVIGLSQDDSPSVSQMLAPFKAVRVSRRWQHEFCEVAA